MARQRLRTTTVSRGTTFAVNYTHYHMVGGVKVIFPLTGATLYFTVKTEEYDDTANDSTALISKTVTSFVDPENGLANVVLTPSDTQIDPGVYYWDIKVKESDGSTFKTAEGLLEIDGSATNRNV